MTLMPNGREPMYGGAEVANFETLDSHVALIANGEYAAVFQRG